MRDMRRGVNGSAIWSTYWRLQERYDELKFAWTVGLMGQFGLSEERQSSGERNSLLVV